MRRSRRRLFTCNGTNGGHDFLGDDLAGVASPPSGHGVRGVEWAGIGIRDPASVPTSQGTRPGPVNLTPALEISSRDRTAFPLWSRVVRAHRLTEPVKVSENYGQTVAKTPVDTFR